MELVLQGRCDVDRGIRDDERIRMTWHIHDEAMADPTVGPDAGIAGYHRAHQFVRVQAALHQRFHLALPHEGHRLGR